MSRARRVALPLLGVVVSATLFAGSRGLDDVARGDQLGPGFWPRLVLIGLALACAAKAAIEWRRRPGATPRMFAPGTVADLAPEELPPVSGRRLALAVGAIVLYVLLTPWLGFPLTTAGFIVVFMAVCGARSGLALATNAVAGTLILVYLFVKLVYLPLPKGAGAFETLTLAVYHALRVF